MSQPLTDADLDRLDEATDSQRAFELPLKELIHLARRGLRAEREVCGTCAECHETGFCMLSGDEWEPYKYCSDWRAKEPK